MVVRLSSLHFKLGPFHPHLGFTARKSSFDVGELILSCDSCVISSNQFRTLSISYSIASDSCILVWQQSSLRCRLLKTQQPSFICVCGPTCSFVRSPITRFALRFPSTLFNQMKRFFSPTEGAIVKGSFSSHTGWVSSVAWSPNNEHLFISGSYDCLLKLWDTRRFDLVSRRF